LHLKEYIKYRKESGVADFVLTSYIQISFMRNIVWVLLICLMVSHVSAQEVYTSSGKQNYHKKGKKKGYDPDKLILGGGLSLNAGGGYVVAGVSPIVGYRFTNYLSAGVGLGYLYFQQPDDWYSTQYKTYYDKGSLVYPNLWAKFFVYKNIYLTGAFEYDMISETVPYVDYYGNESTQKLSVNTEALLFGVGLRQPIGGRVSVFVEAKHEFLQQKYSPYDGQPIIFHIGFCAGL